MGWHSVVHDLARDLALRNHTPPRFAIAPLARSLLSREETRREAIWRWTQAGTPCQTLCHANPALSLHENHLRQHAAQSHRAGDAGKRVRASEEPCGQPWRHLFLR